MRRRDLAAALLLTAIILSGCQSEPKPVVQEKGDTTLATLLVSPEQASDMGYRIQWQTHLALDAAGSKFEHVAALGDAVVTVEEGNFVSVIRASDGAILWREAVGARSDTLSPPYRTRFIIDGRERELIVISTTRRIYLHDVSTGQLIATHYLDYTASTPPLVMDTLAVYGTVGGLIFAQNIRDGFSVWKYQMAGSIPYKLTQMGATIVGVDQKGGVVTLNPADGGLLWRRLDPPWEEVSGRPVAVDAITFVPSEDRTLYAFERTSGKILWRRQYDVPLRHGPALLNERVYQWVPGTGLEAIDIFTGQPTYTLDRQVEPLMGVGRRTMFQDGKNLLLVNVETGAIDATHTLERVDHVIADGNFDANLILFNDDGRIMKLGPKPN